MDRLQVRYPVSMSGGQYLTPHQQSIVRRFYAGADARLGQKLQECISDLAVETDPNKIASLWKSAHAALKSTPADQMKAGRVVAMRDVKGLAEIVEQLSKGTFAGGKNAPPTAASGSGPGVPTMLTPEKPGSPPIGTGAAANPPRAADAAPAEPTLDELKRALSAFKKRLKVIRLDEESKLGGRFTSGGKKSAIVAIQPPTQFSRPVWDALVAKGQMKYSGSGMFELVEGAKSLDG